MHSTLNWHIDHGLWDLWWYLGWTKTILPSIWHHFYCHISSVLARACLVRPKVSVFVSHSWHVCCLFEWCVTDTTMTCLLDPVGHIQIYTLIFSDVLYKMPSISLRPPDSKVHGAHLGPVGPRWAPCWPHEPCYQGCVIPQIVALGAPRGLVWCQVWLRTVPHVVIVAPTYEIQAENHAAR